MGRLGLVSWMICKCANRLWFQLFKPCRINHAASLEMVSTVPSLTGLAPRATLIQRRSQSSRIGLCQGTRSTMDCSRISTFSIMNFDTADTERSSKGIVLRRSTSYTFTLVLCLFKSSLILVATDYLIPILSNYISIEIDIACINRYHYWYTVGKCVISQSCRFYYVNLCRRIVSSDFRGFQAFSCQFKDFQVNSSTWLRFKAGFKLVQVWFQVSSFQSWNE